MSSIVEEAPTTTQPVAVDAPPQNPTTQPDVATPTEQPVQNSEPSATTTDTTVKTTDPAPVKKQFKVTIKNANPLDGSVKTTTNTVNEAELASAKPRDTNLRAPAVLPSSAVSDPHSLMPLELGSVLTIVSLGNIDLRPDFHNERYLYPIGYKSQRQYKSYIDGSTKTTYTCEILDGASGPVFRVSAADDPGVEFTSSTPTGCCTPLVKKVNQVQQASGKRSTTSVSGPEFFGFSNPRVMQLIEMLPDADKCERYAKRYTGDKAVILESAQILGVSSPARKKKDGESKKRKTEGDSKKRKKSKKEDGTSGSESESKRNEILEQHKQKQKDILQMNDDELENAEEYDEELLAGISKKR